MKAGDYVNILNMGTGGTIKKVLPKQKVEVLLDNGFTVQIPTSDITPSFPPKMEDAPPKKVRIAIPPPKVDLHIEQLTNSHEHLSNGEKVQLQLEAFERELSAAMAAGMLEITFIHGIGSGVLRSEIHRLLKKNKDVKSFADAQFDRGATLVKFY